ncbi:phosphotransferase [Streptomyces brasiliscabiei]|uniref:phosphotransferase n=1 Tax=Streptomyces brasiliscabiei TaxID=2736302 RepID=UPI001C11CBFA|nr:phosphotransferase [Streptomyces brasiliscabiei]
MITAPVDPRLELARDRVGAVRVISDPSLPPRLLQLADGWGRRYFAKQHTVKARYVHEVHAYRTWAPHLNGHVPELVGSHDSTHTLLVTALSGTPADTVTPGSPEEEMAHYEAGRILRLLHQATLIPRSGAIGPDLATRLAHWIQQANEAGLISAAERVLLAAHQDILAGTLMDSAVCHLDYQPRNWNIGDSFGVYDLEHMRRDARIRDFARLEFRRWQAAGQLRSAFYSGYGRRPNDTEQRLLESFGAIEAVTALVRGNEQQDLALTAHGRTVLARLS